jgi:hypothetical protein
MRYAEPLLILPAGEIPRTGLQELTRWCAARLDSGERMLTLFGRANISDGDGDGDGIIVTAVTAGAGGGLSVLQADARRGDRFDSLTPAYPAMHMFERELWEQTAVTPAGHPWLKPVRHEGARQQHMTDYPFFQVRGAQVHEVGVGPIHASVIEPGHFRFMCLGEQVHHLEIQLGYQHRGVEQLLLRRNPLLLTSMVESIAGDSSIAYAWAYCAAVEALSETAVSALWTPANGAHQRHHARLRKPLWTRLAEAGRRAVRPAGGIATRSACNACRVCARRRRGQPTNARRA